jgi:hypothetical protein
MRALVLLSALALMACGQPPAVRSSTTSTAASPGPPASPSSSPTPAAAVPTPSAAAASCGYTGSISLLTVVEARYPGFPSLLYETSDPIHPRLVCKSASAELRILTGTSVVYAVRGPTGFRIVSQPVSGGAETELFSAAVGNPVDFDWSTTGAYASAIVAGTDSSNGDQLLRVTLFDGSSTKHLYDDKVQVGFGGAYEFVPPEPFHLSADGRYLVSRFTHSLDPLPLRVYGLDGRLLLSLDRSAIDAVWSRTGHTLWILETGKVQQWTPESGLVDLPKTSGGWLMAVATGSQSLTYTTMDAQGHLSVHVYSPSGGIQDAGPIDRSRGGPIPKLGLWYLEEKSCSAAVAPCPWTTAPDGVILRYDLSTGSEARVQFAPGEAPDGLGLNAFIIGDEWPLS